MPQAAEISSQARAIAWPDVLGRSFAAWQAAGRDVNGISLPGDPTFTQGAYTLGNWAQACGVGSTFDSMWQALRARQKGVWGSFYDAASCYAAFATAYTPTNGSVPAADSTGLGYYGASDNRVSTPTTGGPRVFRVDYNHGPRAFRLTGI